jgi:hypothetical protein
LGHDPEPIDGFEFGMIKHKGMNMDMIKLPWRFSTVVDETSNQVLLCVRDGATGYWTAAVLFDCFGDIFLAKGWKRFCRVHKTEADTSSSSTVPKFEMCLRRCGHVGPLGWVFPAPGYFWTVSDTRGLFASGRWRCPYNISTGEPKMSPKTLPSLSFWLEG